MHPVQPSVGVWTSIQVDAFLSTSLTSIAASQNADGGRTTGGGGESPTPAHVAS